MLLVVAKKGNDKLRGEIPKWKKKLGNVTIGFVFVSGRPIWDVLAEAAPALVVDGGC